MPKKLKKSPKTKAEDNGAAARRNGESSAPAAQSTPEDVIASLKAALRFDTSFAATTLPSDARGEVPELLETLRQLKQKLSGLQGAAETALTRFAPSAEDADGDAVGSARYVEMKVQLLLSYLISLVYYLLLKARGVPVRGHPAVLRLLWVRALIEKLRPVDQRLQYQMNRALQWVEAAAARDGSAAAGGAAVDKMALRPGDLASTVADEPEDEDAPAYMDGVEDDGIYRPPKISQLEYTGDHVTEAERADKQFERKKSRLDRSEFVRSLREEFTDAPAEVQGKMRSATAERAARQLAEQEEYEADNYTRIRTSKKEGAAQKKLLRDTTISSGGTASLHDLSDFRDLAAGLEAGAKGKGKRKGRGGTVLQEYQDAMSRSKRAHGVVDSATGGGDGGGKGGGKRRGGKSDGKGAKRQRT